MALLRHMEKVGKEFIEGKHETIIKEHGYRIGFHGPGNNTVHHLHMHMIVLPFKSYSKK